MKRNGTPRSAPRVTRPRVDPFRYGWRYVERRGPDGEIEVDQVPLTLEDVLHPQEDDVIPENSLRGEERAYLRDVIGERLTHRKKSRVFTDCLINWGVPGLCNYSPDEAVFDQIAEPHGEWGTFPAGRLGARCLFLIELVSPKTRRNDIKRKPPEYQRADVPLYIIVDQQREDGPRRLLCYRNTPQGFVPVSLDDQGRVLLEPLRLLLGLRDNRVVCFDAATGEEIPDYTAVSQARQAAEAKAGEEARARQAAEQRVQELQEELRRLQTAKSSAKKRRRER